jgi:hypothetical protein
MRIELQYKGQKFYVYTIVLNDDSCPTVDFLEELKQDDLASHKSLVNVYTTHADHGPLLNIKKSRPIEDEKNLFEFKTKQGARLLYFYLAGKITVITHGFKKGAPVKQEYQRAKNLRDEYLREIKNDRK